MFDSSLAVFNVDPLTWQILSARNVGLSEVQHVVVKWPHSEVKCMLLHNLPSSYVFIMCCNTAQLHEFFACATHFHLTNFLNWPVLLYKEAKYWMQ